MRLLGCLLALVFLAKRVTSSSGGMCYIDNANTVLSGDRLFFMSGNYTIVSENGQDTTPTESLYWLDINSQFPVEQSIPSNSIYNQSIGSSITIAYENAMKGNKPGAMWNTNNTIYIFGGVNMPTDSLSAYDLATQIWSEVPVAGGDFNFGNRFTAPSISVQDSGLNFIFGGHEPGDIGGMVRFDASDPDNLSWTNETLNNGSYGIEVPNLDSAGFVYIPAGTEGVLIAFGGYNNSAGINPLWGWPYYSDFSLIYIYDIASHTWFLQQASGDIPGSACEFCTVVASSPDDGAFHITMYGGWSLEQQKAFETVYVLSIPAFVWIDVSKQNSTIGRHQLSCELYNDAVMIALGGIVNSREVSITDGSCADAVAPMQALDLSTYDWQVSFNPNITYEVPPVIYNIIGGNSTGGATSTTPRGGFSDPTLAAIMEKRVLQASGATTSSGFATDSTTTAYTTPKAHHSSGAGAIAAGVVGAIVGLALIAGTALFLLRRFRDSRQTGQDSSKKAGKGMQVELDSTHLNELDGSGKTNELDVGTVYEMEHRQLLVELAS